MALIKVLYRNGDQEDFDDSKTNYGVNSINESGNMIIITDPYGKQTLIPLDLIARIEHFTEKQRSF